MIDTSSGQVKAGSTLVEQASQTMQEIVSTSKQVTDIVDEIATASQEQSSGVEQVSLAVTQMDEVTQHNAAQVEQTAAAAEALEGQVKRLESAVSVFRLADSNSDSDSGLELETRAEAITSPPAEEARQRQSPEVPPHKTRSATPKREARKQTPPVKPVGSAPASDDDDWTTF